MSLSVEILRETVVIGHTELIFFYTSSKNTHLEQHSCFRTVFFISQWTFANLPESQSKNTRVQLNLKSLTKKVSYEIFRTAPSKKKKNKKILEIWIGIGKGILECSFTFEHNYCFSKVNILLDLGWIKLETHCHMITISVCLIKKAYILLIVLYVCESFIFKGNMNKNGGKMSPF